MCIHLEVSSYPHWEGQEGSKWAPREMPEPAGPLGEGCRREARRTDPASQTDRWTDGCRLFLTVFDYKIKEFHLFCEILLAARVHSQKDPSAELRQARARGAATGLCSEVTSSSPPAPARSCACNTGLNFYQILKLRKGLNPDPPPTP